MSLKGSVSVPVAGIRDGVHTLAIDRIDATWTAFGMPLVRQVNVKLPVAYLPMPNSPKALSIFRKVSSPGVRLTAVPAQPQRLLTKPAPMVSFFADEGVDLQIYLTCGGPERK